MTVDAKDLADDMPIADGDAVRGYERGAGAAAFAAMGSRAVTEPAHGFRAVRMHRDPGWAGLVDDVAIGDEQMMFRIEQMDDDSFWAAVYVGKRTVSFWLCWDRKKRRLECTLTEDTLGCVDDTERTE